MIPTREQMLAADSWLRSIATDEAGSDCKATLHDALLALTEPAPAAAGGMVCPRRRQRDDRTKELAPREPARA